MGTLRLEVVGHNYDVKVVVDVVQDDETYEFASATVRDVTGIATRWFLPLTPDNFLKVIYNDYYHRYESIDRDTEEMEQLKRVFSQARDPAVLASIDVEKDQLLDELSEVWGDDKQEYVQTRLARIKELQLTQAQIVEKNAKIKEAQKRYDGLWDLRRDNSLKSDHLQKLCDLMETLPANRILWQKP